MPPRPWRRGGRGGAARAGDASHERCKRQRSYAWAKYFEAMERRADMAHAVVRFSGIRLEKDGKVTPAAQLPPHITQEFYDMAVALRKEFNCPICFEQVDKQSFVVTMCGHIYCKTCLASLKAQTDPKCAMCREPLR